MQMVRKMAMIKASELGVKKDAVKVQRRRNAEIAKNLKNSGIPIDVIAKNTGLTQEEIAAL